MEVSQLGQLRIKSFQSVKSLLLVKLVSSANFHFQECVLHLFSSFSRIYSVEGVASSARRESTCLGNE